MLKRLFLLSMLTFISSFALAGGRADTTTVKSIGSGAFYSGQCGFDCVVIQVTSAPTGSSCSYSGGWHFVIDLASPEASTQISTLLAAHASGRKIGIAGNNVCTNNMGLEKVYYIFTHL